jgi:hypothetical protein
MLSCSVWFSAPSFWTCGDLEIHCVGRVYGADGARHHPHRTHPVVICVRDNVKRKTTKVLMYTDMSVFLKGFRLFRELVLWE